MEGKQDFHGKEYSGSSGFRPKPRRGVQGQLAQREQCKSTRRCRSITVCFVFSSIIDIVVGGKRGDSFHQPPSWGSCRVLQQRWGAWVCSCWKHSWWNSCLGARIDSVPGIDAGSTENLGNDCGSRRWKSYAQRASSSSDRGWAVDPFKCEDIRKARKESRYIPRRIALQVGGWRVWGTVNCCQASYYILR